MDQNQFETQLRRREALLAIGGLGASAVLAGCGTGGGAGTAGAGPPTAAQAASACLLQRESTEGPFYLDLDLVRRDIRGDRTGTPLLLRLNVVDATRCEPIRGAVVEIWHTDAAGRYSGVEGDDGNFLRGAQRTNRDGLVRFTTIFPGWYAGRTPHIHTKVFVSGDEVHTGQLFFRPATTRAVYRQGEYAARGQADTPNADDYIYEEAGSRALCPLRRRGASIGAGYTGAMVIGVDVDRS